MDGGMRCAINQRGYRCTQVTRTVSDSGARQVGIGTPMVGFGYIEVSVHHMDVRPGLSHWGFYRMDQGSCFSLLRFASLRIWDPLFEASMSRVLDVMRVRLDGYPLQSGGHGVTGDRNVGRVFLYICRTSTKWR
jgi:hypothetical protein